MATPATWMLKARLGLNGMRHGWRQSSGGSIDLAQVRRPVARCPHHQREGAIGRRRRNQRHSRFRVEVAVG